jgi:folylpolyglutamate synthase/dihydropteroate synthase
MQVMSLQSPCEGRVLNPEPSVSRSSAPPQRYVVLDGAHTRESASALTSTLRAVFPSEPVVLVMAMAADKEHRAVIEEIRNCGPKAVVFTSTAIAGSTDRSCAPGETNDVVFQVFI